MHRSLLSATLLSTTLLAGTAVQADVIQLSGLFDIRQDILVTAVGAPSYQDPFFPENGYPFFEEYSRVLNEEANVFDPSQIPTNPDLADSLVTSFAQLSAGFTFDSSVIGTGNELMTTSSEGTLLGTSNLISTAEVFFGGETVASGIFGSARVLAGNNISAGGDQLLDVIAIQVHNDPITETNGGLTLYLGGDSNWFENLGENTVDFSDLSGLETIQIEYLEEVFSEAGDSLYEERVEGAPVGNIVFNSFGAADGSSEEDPLLPVAVEGENGLPTYEFDLSEVAANSAEDGFTFFDPDVAVGYTYVLEGDGLITAIKAPTLDAVSDVNGYIITTASETFTLLPGEEMTLTTPVKTLVLSDIDPTLLLDPLSGTVFVAGFKFDGLSTTSSFSQTATVEFFDDTQSPSTVPVPASLLLLGTALGGLGFARRRRNA